MSKSTRNQDIDVYLKLLTQANRIEQFDPPHCLDLLQKIIELWKKSNQIQAIRPKDVQNLEARVRYLSEYIKHWSSEKRKRKVRKQTKPETIGFDTDIKKQEVIPKELSATSSTTVSEFTPLPRFLEDKIYPNEVDLIFHKMRNKETPTYEEYYEFWNFIAEHATDFNHPIIYDTSSISYYVGDTHGSYNEALIMVNYFLQVIEKFPQVKIIFIGDYVDRNPQDLENLSLITAFRLLYPENVVMLRGNHEDLKINSAYGFIKNLQDNFIIEDYVEKIYTRILQYFTSLPIAHVNSLTNNPSQMIRILAVHGGIPVHIHEPETPVLLSEVESKAQWNEPTYETFDTFTNWMMWADPKEDLQGIISDPMTGRNQFGSDAFWAFLNANNLHFMVRAHEKWPNGYKFFFNDSLVSLFSTSFYNGKLIGNAAIMRLEPGKAPTILIPTKEALQKDFSDNL